MLRTAKYGLSAALNVNGKLWKTSPAATELEEVVLGWLRQMLGLPNAYHGVLTDSASVSSLVAMAAAHERIPGLRVRQEGFSWPAGGATPSGVRIGAGPLLHRKSSHHPRNRAAGGAEDRYRPYLPAGSGQPGAGDCG